MIYVSSSCVRARTIAESVEQLALAGFRNIELSGGTVPYPRLEADLFALQKRFDLHYLCHNYFPPPPEAFVINIASLDKDVERLSMEHLERAITLSHKLDAHKFGFHAGFLINIPVAQVGKSITRQDLFDKDEAAEVFIRNFNTLKGFAGNSLSLYLENNVISSENLSNYNGTNPFFITEKDNYGYFRKKMDFSLLLDLAHLKVSCRSLGLDLKEQMGSLIPETDYIHISDNDGLRDDNRSFEKEGELFALLKDSDLKGKTFTLEVYSGLDDLKRSFDNLSELL